MQGPDPTLPWPIDYTTGVLPIATDEQGPHGGVALAAYQCCAGRWTCGWGETDGVTPNTRWTQAYADQRLCDSLAERTRAVQAACTVEPTPHQLAALVSFAYNYKGWRTSSALKAHNRGDALAAANALQLVDKYTNPRTGKLEVAAGLRKRRAREAALYLTPCEGAHAMPQAVQPETSLAASPTAQAGAVTAGAGALSLLSQTGDQVQAVSGTVQQVKALATDTLGIPASWVLPGLLIAVGAVVLYYRAKQRREGWA